ncbi:MAG: hypothetical protein KF802_13850 [Bdellovibrionaceae bacterium]|nr:hypothetical protein [Pseudobdellovibrionaceae bacterium]MBX3033112.1 hypothetical protein [Pseudobdellovibrionaceae bacterium]
MPENWKCNLEVTEWVCRAEQGKEAKEAIIILTAKEVGPPDSFALYEQYLNKPITLQTKVGGSSESKIVYKAKNVSINDQPWVDGLHLGSEVPNYFTRYLATIKDKIAILVTLSAHKNYYTRYSQEFFKTVMSLKVIATKNLGSRPDLGPIRPGSEGLLGPGVGSGMPADMMDGDLTQDGGSGNKGKGPLVLIALALAAAGGYLFMKKRRK